MKLAELYEIMDEPRKALELVYQGNFFHSIVTYWAGLIGATQSLTLGNAALAKGKARHSLMRLQVPSPALPCLTRSLMFDRKEEPLNTADSLWLISGLSRNNVRKRSYLGTNGSKSCGPAS